jgi:hypothetical protein
VRTPAGELRSFDQETGEFEIAAVTYNKTDGYNTRFLPGVFTESVRQKMPVAHFGHNEDRSRLIAEFVDYREEPDQLVLVGQMRPRETSSWVKRAWTGLSSRVLTDWSVVFHRQEGGTRQAPDGVTEFVRAQLRRVDVVLEGAVPGAQLLSFRSAQEIGPVAARIAAAERAAGIGPVVPASHSAAIREALAALDELEI